MSAIKSFFSNYFNSVPQGDYSQGEDPAAVAARRKLALAAAQANKGMHIDPAARNPLDPFGPVPGGADRITESGDYNPFNTKAAAPFKISGIQSLPERVDFSDIAKGYRGLGSKQMISKEQLMRALLNDGADPRVRSRAQQSVNSQYGGAIGNLRTQMGQNAAAAEKGVADTRGFYDQAVRQSKTEANDLNTANAKLTKAYGNVAAGINSLPGTGGKSILAERNLLGAGATRDVGKTQRNAMAMLAQNTAATGAFQGQNVRNQYALQQQDLASKMQEIQLQKAGALREAYEQMKNDKLENMVKAYQLQGAGGNPYDRDRGKYLKAQQMLHVAVSEEGEDPVLAYRLAKDRTPKKFHPLLRQYFEDNKSRYEKKYKAAQAAEEAATAAIEKKKDK